MQSEDERTQVILFGDGSPVPTGVMHALGVKGERGEVTDKNPHGSNRKARRAKAAEDRRINRKIRKAIANLDGLQLRFRG